MGSFAIKLIRWQKQHGRHDLPWQNRRDPYAIWVSEVMLQQTQVRTVIPYYLRFLQCFPDIATLASASLDDVLAQWSGLGYYSRGRNLHRAARLIVTDHGGTFPENPDVIRQLPGIGRSTAGAIAVFAFGARCTILDGNVKRVLARCFGIDGFPGEKKNQMLLWRKAEELLPMPHAADKDSVTGEIEVYTQALMDLGASICTRGSPECGSCPLQRDCVAFRDGGLDKLPVPRRRKPLPERQAVLLVLMNEGKILLEKRPAAGIWGSLWCLPEMSLGNDAIDYCSLHFGMEAQPMRQLQPFDHTFTHFRLRIHPQPLKIVSYPLTVTQGSRPAVWTTLEEALTAAIPSPVRKLLMSMEPVS
ncbi:MAG: A/G-specific adenine glycosylase [Nitrosospira sp.]|nr:A/G-specific adenine glycosylase [Nitrosospira sp.]